MEPEQNHIDVICWNEEIFEIVRVYKENVRLIN